MSKTARLSPVAFDVVCPHCEADIASPTTGSLMWTLDDVREYTVVTCFYCKKEVKLPKQ